MPFFPIDDKFHSHPKAIKAGTAAVGLWALCGSWSNDQGTDGFVPDYIAARFDREYETLAARLVEVRLFEVAERDGDKGWQFHDWTGEETGTKRNYTRAEVEQKRRDQAERKARSRQRSQETGQFVTRDNAVTHAGQNGDSRGTHAGQERDSPVRPGIPGKVTRDIDVTTASRHTVPIPSHPIPSQEPKGQNQEPLTAVDPLTRQTEISASKINGAPTGAVPEPGSARFTARMPCPEHGRPYRAGTCDICISERGSASWWVTHPVPPKLLERYEAAEAADRERTARREAARKDRS